MQIRPALPEDAAAISALIRSVAHFFTLDPAGAGAEGFLETISPEAMAGYLGSERYRYLVGLEDGVLAGVVALRDASHLFHLFVAPAFQRRGLARALWLQVSAAAHPGLSGFTVNSTPYAVPVYEALGFRVAGARVETHGIAFVPMRTR